MLLIPKIPHSVRNDKGASQRSLLMLTRFQKNDSGRKAFWILPDDPGSRQRRYHLLRITQHRLGLSAFQIRHFLSRDKISLLEPIALAIYFIWRRNVHA